MDGVTPRLKCGHELQKQISLQGITGFPDVTFSNRTGFPNGLQNVPRAKKRSSYAKPKQENCHLVQKRRQENEVERPNETGEYKIKRCNIFKHTSALFRGGGAHHKVNIQESSKFTATFQGIPCCCPVKIYSSI